MTILIETERRGRKDGDYTGRTFAERGGKIEKAASAVIETASAQLHAEGMSECLIGWWRRGFLRGFEPHIQLQIFPASDIACASKARREMLKKKQAKRAGPAVHVPRPSEIPTVSDTRQLEHLGRRHGENYARIFIAQDAGRTSQSSARFSEQMDIRVDEFAGQLKQLGMSDDSLFVYSDAVFAGHKATLEGVTALVNLGTRVARELFSPHC